MLCNAVPVPDLLVPLNGINLEVMDPRCFLKTFAIGKEQSEEKSRWREREGKTGRVDKQADGSNSSTVLWATGKQNVLIFEGCKTFVCPQCLRRNLIPALTTKAAFDQKFWEKSGENYRFFLFPASWLIVVLVQFWNSICLFVLSRCVPLPEFGKAAHVSSLCRGGHMLSNKGNTEVKLWLLKKM